MKRQLAGYRTLAVVLFALLVVSTTYAWARSTGALGQLDLLLDVRHEIVSNYVDAPDQDAMTQAAVRGMVDSLDDPFTVYLSPEELKPFERSVTGKFTGIGAEVDMSQGRLRIVSPLEDSPAYKAGVMAGDLVLKIGDEDTLGLKLTDAVKKLTGDAGTDVTITVRHPDGEEEPITITRAQIQVQTVRGFERGKDQHYDYLLTTGKPRIGYVRLTQFSDDTADDLRRVIQQLKSSGAQGLILDLRFNPGGLLESAVAISDMFLPRGKTIVSVKGRVVPEDSSKATSDTIVPADWPVVVLVNGASASAAEIVTGALKDNGRARVVGTRSFGKGSVQQVRALERAPGAIKLTTAYYYIPSGRKIHRVPGAKRWGVDPTDGDYIAMTPDQIKDMVTTRRDAEVLSNDNGQDGHPDVTPQWINDTLKDPQLAGALRAINGKLDSGDWPTVGEPNTEAQVQASHRNNLLRQRELLMDRLGDVNDELTDMGEPMTDRDAPAAEDDGATKPGDVPEDVTPEAKQRMQQQPKSNNDSAGADDATDDGDAQSAPDNKRELPETEPVS